MNRVTVVLNEEDVRKILERPGHAKVSDEFVKKMTPKIQAAVQATYNENVLDEAEYILNDWNL